MFLISLSTWSTSLPGRVGYRGGVILRLFPYKHFLPWTWILILDWFGLGFRSRRTGLGSRAWHYIYVDGIYTLHIYFWIKGKDDLCAEKREPVKHLVFTLAARWTQIQPWISPQCSCCALRFIELGKGEKRKGRNRDHFQILLRPWLRGREISRR